MCYAFGLTDSLLIAWLNICLQKNSKQTLSIFLDQYNGCHYLIVVPSTENRIECYRALCPTRRSDQ